MYKTVDGRPLGNQVSEELKRARQNATERVLKGEMVVRVAYNGRVLATEKNPGEDGDVEAVYLTGGFGIAGGRTRSANVPPANFVLEGRKLTIPVNGVEVEIEDDVAALLKK